MSANSLGQYIIKVQSLKVQKRYRDGLQFGRLKLLTHIACISSWDILGFLVQVMDAGNVEKMLFCRPEPSTSQEMKNKSISPLHNKLYEFTYDDP